MVSSSVFKYVVICLARVVNIIRWLLTIFLGMSEMGFLREKPKFAQFFFCLKGKRLCPGFRCWLQRAVSAAEIHRKRWSAAPLMAVRCTDLSSGMLITRRQQRKWWTAIYKHPATAEFNPRYGSPGDSFRGYSTTLAIQRLYWPSGSGGQFWSGMTGRIVCTAVGNRGR